MENQRFLYEYESLKYTTNISLSISEYKYYKDILSIDIVCPNTLQKTPFT